MESCQKSLVLLGKVTFGKTLFRLLIDSPAITVAFIDYMSLFWDMLHYKLTSSLLIYHNFIIGKMSYQAK